MGFISVDSTNHGLKIFEKKIPGNFKKQNLNLLHADNYLHSIYTVFKYLEQHSFDKYLQGFTDVESQL